MVCRREYILWTHRTLDSDDDIALRDIRSPRRVYFVRLCLCSLAKLEQEDAGDAAGIVVGAMEAIAIEVSGE